MRLGRVFRRRAAKTPNSTSLGTVPKALTTRARGTFRASASAPEEGGVSPRSGSSAFIGSEQVISTFPARSPAWPSTSSSRDQWIARSRASALPPASASVPARAVAGGGGQRLELLPAPGVAEDHLVSGPGED